MDCTSHFHPLVSTEREREDRQFNEYRSARSPFLIVYNSLLTELNVFNRKIGPLFFSARNTTIVPLRDCGIRTEYIKDPFLVSLTCVGHVHYPP
jgi:hypothetical protein